MFNELYSVIGKCTFVWKPCGQWTKHQTYYIILGKIGFHDIINRILYLDVGMTFNIVFVNYNNSPPLLHLTRFKSENCVYKKMALTVKSHTEIPFHTQAGF